MNYDKILDQIFFINDIYNISKVIKFNRLKKKKYLNIYNYLNNRFKDSKSERESIYRIHYNIEETPLCPVCGNPLSFSGRRNQLFLSHCSNKCKKLDKNVNNKWKLSCGEKGTNRNKAKKTMIQKYGVENPYQIPEVIEKIKIINKEKLQESLIKQEFTNLQKYGVKSYFQTEEFKEKSKITSLLKYGVDKPIKNQIIKNKYNWQEITQKIYLTKKKNHSFNTSKIEDQSYELLKEKYPDVIRQYKNELYPFNCDFYIPSLDLYIECQFCQFHGKHPFDENNKNDLLYLEELKEKANKSERHKLGKKSQYDKMIYIWTDLDVRKRNIAKQNKLNYIEFWDIEEIKKWKNNTYANL